MSILKGFSITHLIVYYAYKMLIYAVCGAIFCEHCANGAQEQKIAHARHVSEILDINTLCLYT